MFAFVNPELDYVYPFESPSIYTKMVRLEVGKVNSRESLRQSVTKYVRDVWTRALLRG
jgi:hypothetical protein